MFTGSPVQGKSKNDFKRKEVIHLSDLESKEIDLSIPAMIWMTWETLVKLALEKSDGVKDFKLKLASAWVKFDPSEITEETIIKNIQKTTRYDNVSVKQPEA